MKTYKYYQDPSHGWIAVKTEEVISLGLINQISGYSYISKSGKTIYLEEDRDRLLFSNAKKAVNQPYKLKDIYSNKQSSIRNLDHVSDCFTRRKETDT